MNKKLIMQNTMKWVLTMLFMLFICGSSTKTTYASQFLDAREIQVNRNVDGSLINGYGYHQNYYKFFTSQPGYVNINFSNPMQNSSEEYWRVTMYNDYYDELYTGSIYGNRKNTDLMTIGIPAGTYYIKITSASEREVKSSDTYTFRANFTVSDTWEKELNETFVSATPIELNMDYYGTIRNGFEIEKDFYKLTITQPGCLDVQFSNPLQNNLQEYWKVYLYNSSYEEICKTSVFGNQKYTNLPSIGLDRGTYYIKVTSAAWMEASSTEIYTLRANFRASDTWEKELNDDFTTATEILPNTLYYGTTSDGTDYEKDFYKFGAPSGGTYRIQVRTPNLKDSGAFWKLYLYDANYTELACVDVFGNQTIQYIDKELFAGTHYIQIASIYWNKARSTEIYELSVVKLNDFGRPETPTQPSTPTQPTTPTQPSIPTQPSTPQDEYYSVEWNVSSATLQVGQSTDVLVAEVTGNDEVEIYASSNTEVVTIEANGVIRAHKAGTAKIRAITKHGCVAMLDIKVQKKAIATKSIVVDSKNVTLQETGTYELEAELTPITSSQEIKYTSANSKIASVSKSGVITAKQKGTTTIKVKSGKITVKVKVRVQ